MSVHPKGASEGSRTWIQHWGVTAGSPKAQGCGCWDGSRMQDCSSAGPGHPQDSVGMGGPAQCFPPCPTPLPMPGCCSQGESPPPAQAPWDEERVKAPWSFPSLSPSAPEGRLHPSSRSSDTGQGPYKGHPLSTPCSLTVAPRERVWGEQEEGEDGGSGQAQKCL